VMMQGATATMPHSSAANATDKWQYTWLLSQSLTLQQQTE
jgi:hypothetical protein